MKIHWRLAKKYIEKSDRKSDGCKSASNCECCEIENKDCTKCNKGCLNYIGCGPWNRCERPCKYCLYWTGYGLEYEDSLDNDGVIL